MDARAALDAAIQERVEAIRRKDVERLLAGYAEDVRTFDLIAPLGNTGREAVRRRVTEWFGSFASVLHYELRDVAPVLDGDVAFDSHLTHVRGDNRAGAHVDMWFRETVGYRRVGGRWLVVHQHSSVPFDMGSGQALVGLRP